MNEVLAAKSRVGKNSCPSSSAKLNSPLAAFESSTRAPHSMLTKRRATGRLWRGAGGWLLEHRKHPKPLIDSSDRAHSIDDPNPSASPLSRFRNIPSACGYVSPRRHATTQATTLRHAVGSGAQTGCAMTGSSTDAIQRPHRWVSPTTTGTKNDGVARSSSTNWR